MVAEHSARHALPKEVVEDVAARTGGVPLFVEEVTRLLLERGEHGGIQTIPPTLQQSLMARLDRLGPAREVAQVGAVIGRGFSYALLRAVAGIEDAPLQAALEKLAEADIVLVRGLPPESDYRFKSSSHARAGFPLLSWRSRSTRLTPASSRRQGASACHLLNVAIFIRAGARRQIAGLAENSNAWHKYITRPSDRVRRHMAQEPVFGAVGQRLRAIARVQTVKAAVSSVVTALGLISSQRRLRAERDDNRCEHKA
jgi:hypothetical protein